MRRERAGLLIAVVGTVVIITAAVLLILPRVAGGTTVRVGDAVIMASLAVTDKERDRGLSGRSSLESTEGMLFVFPHEEEWGIWMKDMEVPIDIIWLDSDKKVIDIAKNVSPDTYPESFAPDSKARYVLEIASGTVESKGIHRGHVATFDLPQ